MRYAIEEQLKTPPAEFEEALRDHFRCAQDYALLSVLQPGNRLPLPLPLCLRCSACAGTSHDQQAAGPADAQP